MLQSYFTESESHADQLAYDRRERQSHRVTPVPSRKDIEQDNRLRSLERDNHRLQCCVTALIKVIRAAGMISEREIEALAAEAESSKPHYVHAGASSESIRQHA